MNPRVNIVYFWINLFIIPYVFIIQFFYISCKPHDEGSSLIFLLNFFPSQSEFASGIILFIFFCIFVLDFVFLSVSFDFLSLFSCNLRVSFFFLTFLLLSFFTYLHLSSDEAINSKQICFLKKKKKKISKMPRGYQSKF